MKTLKLTGLAALVIILAAGAAYAGEYGKGASQAGMGMHEQGVIEEGSGIFYRGTVAALNEEGREIRVKTMVPGLLGPTERTLPFKVDRDTTVNICFKSINRCDASANGIDGWRMLAALEGFESLSGIRKNVTVIGAAGTDRVVHLQVEYGL